MSARQADTARARIEALAVLPLFVKLEGARAVVAGGTDGAAWKAELLASAGAQVHVYAECVGEGMQAVLMREPVAGTVTLHAEAWSESAFDNTLLAVIDAADYAEGVRFVTAARARGAIANVVDRPVAGTVQFGAIVNRSPMVVGISSAGAAPVFAQRVRQCIEAALPLTLGAWGALARRIRPTVMAWLSSGDARRRFWRRLGDRAFAEAFDAGSPALAEAMLDAQASNAAPDNASHGSYAVLSVDNDPDNLTLGQIRELGRADVIVHPPQLATRVLELGRREAERRCVEAGGGRCERLARNLGDTGCRVVCLVLRDAPRDPSRQVLPASSLDSPRAMTAWR